VGAVLKTEMEKLFGTDGIRGTVGEFPLVPDFVLRLGQAVGTILRRRSTSSSVVVGRDTRESGPALQAALTAGLLATGVDVIDVGVISTPGVAALTRHLKAATGIVISASYNPVEQNGIKFFNEVGQKLSADIEDEIERLAAGPNAGWDAMKAIPRKRLGCLIEGAHFHEAYIRGLLSEHPASFLDGINLVMDCGNGAAYKLAPEVFTRAGAVVRAVNSSPTGLNINADSGSEHVRREPKEMAEWIRKHGADFGIAFDGDADRVVFIDEHGKLVDGDHMLGVFALYLNKRKQLLAGTVVTTTMRNTGLKNYVESAGIKLEETPVGDKYVIERLIELRREFAGDGLLGLGGEQAGHLILLDDEHFTGDGMRTGLFFARVFRESGAASLSAFAAEVGKTPQIIASAGAVDLPRLDKKQLAEMEKTTLAETPGLIRANLRYSGTEPLFRVMLECDNRVSGKELAALAVKLCRRVQSEREIEEGTIDILDCTSGKITL